MNISKKRLDRVFGDMLRHNSENPERDLADLHAILTGCSKASVKLEVANQILGGYGVEALHSEHAQFDSNWADIIADYVNMGDTYTPTILRDRSGKLHAVSWGDWYERTPEYRQASRSNE